MEGEPDKLDILRDKLMKQRLELADKVRAIDSKLSRIEEVLQMVLKEGRTKETEGVS